MTQTYAIEHRRAEDLNAGDIFRLKGHRSARIFQRIESVAILDDVVIVRTKHVPWPLHFDTHRLVEVQVAK